MNIQHWLSRNFFIFFLTWGIFLPYWTGWLVQDKGLSVSEASLIMGVGLVARGLSTLFAFPLASRFFSAHKIILSLTVLSFVATILYIPSSSFVTLLIVTILFSAVYPTLLPAVESAASILVSQHGIHYGMSRKYGSIAFVISVFIISALTGQWGEQAILWSMLVGISFILIMSFLPVPPILLEEPKKQSRKGSLSVRKLFEVKSFPIVLLVVVLLQGAHASYYNYGYIYLQDLQVNEYYIGLIINIAVIFEILYFLKADNLFKNWNTSKLLLLAAAGSTLRWVLVFLFPNIWVFILSQSLHALSFAVAHYAFIGYISKHLQKEQIPNAQGIYNAIGLSLSTAILTLFGGYLYEISPNLAFLGMVICTIPAIFIIIATRNRYRY